MRTFSFNVEIWEEDDEIKFGASEEVDGESVFLGGGTYGTLDGVTEAIREIILDVFC